MFCQELEVNRSNLRIITDIIIGQHVVQSLTNFVKEVQIKAPKGEIFYIKSHVTYIMYVRELIIKVNIFI